MRIAVVSDIHGNLPALDAVIADLRETRPDLVVQGGDLVVGGARPAEVIDRIREMNWPGVYGNAEEMLWMPHRVSEMLQAPHLHRIRNIVLTHTIPSTLSAIGDERLAWLSALPRRWSSANLTVVHAVPESVWPVTPADASDEELTRVYGVLGSTRVVYGHIHQPFVRPLPAFTVANAGAVSQSYDGDPRAAYAIVDDDRIEIRRVEYDVEDEIRRLLATDDPFAESTAATLRTGRYMPPARRGLDMFTLDQVVPWGRSFDEYRRMFDLTEGDLGGTLLGCGDGPASFNATATARGCDVMSVDPLYGYSAEQIRGRVEATAPVIAAELRGNAGEFVWSHFQSVDALIEARLSVMRAFLEDFPDGVRSGRYVDAMLPLLPFADGAFDLALCSHFLFLYSEQHDLAFHVAALGELIRVAREVRIFPLLELGGLPSRHLSGVADALTRDGYRVDRVRVDYEFVKGGNEMIRVSR